MRLSVERLRWGLLAGALLLIAVLVVLLSYGRYRAVQAWKQIVKRSGATISHDTNGVTYSQAVGGKTIFMLHAKRAVPQGQGRYTLEDGMLLLYGPDGQPADRISGAQFAYDEKQGVARAVGPVDMEVEPPAGLSSGPRARGPEGQKAEGQSEIAAPQAIHVRTSGLTYVKKLGVASTDEDVEIDYAGMHGHAHGAQFDSGQGVVHLLADVRVEGNLRGTPATLTAARADLNRDENQIALAAPVMRSAGRMGSAGTAVLHLRKDGSLEAVEASGGIRLQQETRTITAASLRAAMNEQSQMKSAELAGGVGLVDTSTERPMHGAAKTAHVAFDGAGYATSAVMDGAVTMLMEDHRTGAAMQRQMGADRVTLTMERVAHHGAHSGSRVSAVHAQGTAWARGDAVVRGAGAKVGGLKTTSVAGDDLRLVLARDEAGKDEPQTLSGTGHTRIEQKMLDGTVQTSAGNALEVRFAPQASGGLEIASADQTGNVQIRSVPGKPGEQSSEGVAERASLDGENNVVTLTGRPRLTQGDTSVTADAIRLMQQTGDAVATGSVAGTFVSANAKAGSVMPANPANRSPGAPGSLTPANKSAGSPGSLTPANKFAGGPGSAVTHALAAEAVLRRAEQRVELKGTDAAPARIWQGASQVQAANLVLDRAKDSMQAWPAAASGVVRAVFAERQGSEGQRSGARDRGLGPRARGPEGQRAGERVVRVTSARLDYSGMAHQAVFTGGVLAEGEDGTVRGQRAVVFLAQGAGSREQAAGPGARGTEGQDRRGAEDVKGLPDPTAAAVERIVMSGAVKVEQPGRTATGDQLLYTAATGEFVLTGTAGHPPRVVDEKQGNMTGATLLFRSPDSTIVVAGEPASRRVHTETTIKR